MSTEANYLWDLGLFIREAALEAKELAHSADEAEPRTFHQGRLMAYNEVVSLMQQQANAFQLPLAKIRLESIDPDRDLI